MTDLTEIPNITNALLKVRQINDESLDRLCRILYRCEMPRRHLLVQEGYKCGHAYFIERGITRSFWIVDGAEITTSFSTEGGIVFSMDELYYDAISQEYVESIEPLICYSVRLTDLKDLFECDINFANWGREIHQNEYRRLHRSHKERLTLNASDRYHAFAEQFPDVCRRARLSDIASYLGITLSTLSRIRSLRQ